MKNAALVVLLFVPVWAGELSEVQRNDACFAMRGQTSAEAIAQMRRGMDDPVIRACAAANLRVAKAVDALIDAMETGAPDTRIAAARELGALRDRRALAVLGRGAIDANALVAGAAIGALGDYEDEAALPYLLKAAESPTVTGVNALAQAARLKNPAVLPAARAVLKNGDVAAKLVALGIIGEMGDASDVPLLRELARESEPVSARGRGFGFMPAIDVARAARNAIARIEK